MYHLDKNPCTIRLEDFELILCVCACTVINIEFESPFVHASLRNYFKRKQTYDFSDGNFMLQCFFGFF